jgi:hypothetical protein
MKKQIYSPTIKDFITIGSFVKFLYPTGEKYGAVKDIVEFVNGIYLTIYCQDDRGGFTLTAPLYNIIEVKEFKLEEIKKPARYNKRGKLECWDVVLDQEMNFLEGNILKYLWRYKEKNGVEDLKKAKVYLDKLISEVEKK